MHAIIDGLEPLDDYGVYLLEHYEVDYIRTRKVWMKHFDDTTKVCGGSIVGKDIYDVPIWKDTKEMQSLRLFAAKKKLQEFYRHRGGTIA